MTVTPEKVREFFKKDKFAEYCGIELMEIEPGRAKAKLLIEKHHLNGLGMAHGAAMFTLADLVFAVAANAHGTMAMAVNINMTFMKAAKKGETLIAECNENTKNPKLGSYTAKVHNQNGQLLAVFEGLAYRKKDPIA
jgi:acyl-CoA thioesterase